MRRGGARDVDPQDARAARVSALDALARRDRSSSELARKLTEKGFDAIVSRDVVERLIDEQLVDDRRYVENFVAYHAARGQGPRRVQAELYRIGLSGELVHNALDAYPDWTAQLLRAQQKKFGPQVPTLYADKQRQSRFLNYRGFTGAQIRMALGFDTDLDAD